MPISTVTVLQTLVSYSFFLTMVTMAAAAIFLMLERPQVLPKFRSTIAVSITILLIAATSYFCMYHFYSDSLSGKAVGFPTAFRYMDWLLTTPLLLIKFPLLLGVGDKGRPFMIKLVIFDLIMIITGLLGELNYGNARLHYGLFLAGCICWLAIVVMMFNALQNLPERAGPALRGALKLLSFSFLVGWAVYPLGYIAPLLEVPQDVRELVYNIADILNKVVPALAIYLAAKATAHEEEEASAIANVEPELAYN